MQTFKLVMRLFKSHRNSLLIIIGVFFGIAVIMSDLNSSKASGDFTATRLCIGMVDEGNGTIADFIRDYFGEEHDLKDFQYDEKEIVNELYWKSVDYVLMIPEKADEEFLKKDGKISLNCMKVPGHSANGLFETELQICLAKLHALLNAGFSMEEAQEKLLSMKDEKAEVIMAKTVNENSRDRISRFLMYVPYLFIAICVEGIGFILLIVNGRLVKSRVECSSTAMKERIAGITLGILCFGLFIYLMVFAVGAVLSGGSLFTDSRTPYFMLNAFVLLLFSLSLGFLTGMIAKSTASLNGYQNIFALALCFLGGVFVPQEVLGEKALQVGRLLPTYWYVVSTEQISSMVKVTAKFNEEIMKNSFIIFCYAAAVFSLALLVMATKRRNAAE